MYKRQWLTYVFDGDARQYSNYELPFPEFYDKMRKGSVARTSAVNADAFVPVSYTHLDVYKRQRNPQRCRR